MTCPLAVSSTFLFYVMASRNFGNVKAAAVKRHPGSNVTGVTSF
jgi:hypothetical protein